MKIFFIYLSLSKANISFLKKSIKINDAREFIKQPIDTLAKNIEDHYFIKYSLNDKPKNKTISKSKYSNLFANSDETSNFLKQSSTKEESFSKNERLSSFCTYRESIKKKSISRVCNLDDSFIFDPKDITIKTKTINSNLEFINLYNFFLTKSSIFGWFNISKKELQNKIDLSKDKFKLGIFEKEKKIQEQDQKIFELNNRILSLQNENLILRNKNRELKIDFKYNKANIIEKFFYEQSIEVFSYF